MNSSHTPKTIALIGNGSWATALAKILTDNGHSIAWWCRNPDSAEYLSQHHHNEHYLSSVHFDPALLRPSASLEEVCGNSDDWVFAVPSAYARPVLQRLAALGLQGRTIISAVKGVLPEEHELINDFLAGQGMSEDQYVAITGPCHAEEVAGERLSYLTFSSTDGDRAAAVASMFQTPYLRTTWNTNMKGTQYAAVLKNIYAVGAGMAHGLDYGDNFLSVFITACYRELYQFLQTLFERSGQEAASRPDFHTSAYLGDLLVTCYSLHSRNRRFGAMIGKGYSVQAAALEMNMVAEGYYAAKGMRHIHEGLEVEMPIATLVYDILWKAAPVKQRFHALEASLS